MAVHNVAPQEGFPMRVVSGTLIVVLTLLGLLIFGPVLFVAAVVIFGSHAKLFGIFILLAIVAQILIKAGESKRGAAIKRQQQTLAQGRAYLDSLRSQQKGK